MMRLLKNSFHFFNALLANLYYGFPARRLRVIGITGTDGKTTTANLLYEILKLAGKKVAIISTVEAKIDNQSYDTGFHVTTPSPWLLQKLIKIAVEKRVEYLVLEVTSHALDQWRTLGVSIEIALVTNISHEHLDYHKTFENYRAAKAKILRKVKFSILNRDDSNFTYLAKRAGGKIVCYSLRKKADFTLKDFNFKTSLPGDFNLSNCLAAASIAAILGIDKEKIKIAISQFKGVIGRMEEVKTDKEFKIIIDFAHKPNALANVLSYARKITKNKLIVVFGCAGERDRLKRPIMGEIAGRLADYIVLTAEDPRREDVREIIKEIAIGCLKAKVLAGNKYDKKMEFLKDKKKYFFSIPDRQEAINFAIRKLAKKDDLVVLCGKGHEKSMCYGRTEYPWDEKKAVLKALYGKI